jgi:small GTP-binding protein
MEIHHRFKVILLGDSSVGKTSIACQYAGQTRPKDHIPTIGASLFTSDLAISDTPCSLEIWDTAGQDLYRGLIPLYVHGASGALVVFDITSLTSFQHINDWLQFIDDLNANTFIVIFGNKSDLEDDRSISLADAITFTTDKGLTYIEGSAKTSLHINDAFEIIAKGCMDSLDKRGKDGPEPTVLDGEKEGGSNCC